ncbi:MAG: glutamate decarboxylase [Thermacetogeniaceae bacterium]|jgi:glutamate decarboxylase
MKGAKKSLIFKKDLYRLSDSELSLSPTYATRYFVERVPKYRLPEKMMPADVAYQIIHDELYMDGNTAFDLGSFTTTWMEPEAEKLIIENLGKNFIDRFEYPQTNEIHQRVVHILAHLFNAHEQVQFCGTATLGSSEAIELGLLAHKWTWKKRRMEQGKPHDRPNIVFGAGAHICWNKFAKYFDVEPRIIPMETNRFTIDPGQVAACIDENTICVGAVIGTTYTGACEPVAEINNLLIAVKRDKGWDIPIHVDAASGGFILPFTKPDLKWDFRVPQVRSINVSGHKFGLVYPGLGWLIFKDAKNLPEELVFHVNYLGETMSTYTLNFSGGSSMMLAQYYNLLRLGREGYTSIMNNCMQNARYLAQRLVATGKFELLSEIVLPIVAFKFKRDPGFSPFQLSQKLRERGWMLPAYRLPENAESITALRVVVKESFSEDMAEILVNDIEGAYNILDGKKVVLLEPPPKLKKQLSI